MDDATGLGFAVAFASGLLSFLSPCVLPLVPSYIGFLTGMSAGEVTRRRRLAVLHALAFVVGFSLVFVLAGATATALGRAIRYNDVWIQRIGGGLLILFGILMLNIIPLPFLNREARWHLQDKPVGFFGSLVVGITFGAGWTPCIGPILGGILSLAATETSVGRGMLLLTVYSAGLAVPFLLAALALDRFLQWFQRFRRYMPWVQRIGGILLILVGLLLLTGAFTRLAGWLQGLTPGFLQEQL